VYTFSPYDALNGSKYDLPLARNLNLNMKIWHPVKTFTHTKSGYWKLNYIVETLSK